MAKYSIKTGFGLSFSIKTGFGLSLKTLGIALLGLLLLSGCDSGSNNADPNAYVTMSIAKSTASSTGSGGVTAQQFANVTSIIITISGDNGYSTSGDIKKNGGNLTFSVRPYTPLKVSGVAYEGNEATYKGEKSVKALRPGEVANISFALDPIVPFPDPNFASCVNDEMQFRNYQSYADVTYLDCSCYGVTNIQGIQKLTNLQTLGFTWGECDPDQVSDLSPLVGLTKLNSLDLSYNNVADITPLSTLPSLKTLTLYGNHITDITALNSMAALESADIRWNNVSTVALAGLPNLMSLNLSANSITSFSITGSMPKLNALDISSNFITNFSIAGVAGDFPNLQRLSLGYNNIKNIDDLGKLTALQNVDLYSNNVEDVTVLSNLSSTMTSLGLAFNNIKTGVPSLSALTSLTSISLLSNPSLTCADIQSLDGSLDLGDGPSAGKVQWTSCFDNPLISSLSFNDSALATCINGSVDGGTVNDLTSLVCESSGIVDLTGISQLVKLQLLDLKNNPITKFTGLSNLRDLTSLDLTSTGLSDTSVLSYVRNLQDLKLDSNPLIYIGDLHSYNNYMGELTNLTALSLKNNQISDTLNGLTTLFKAQTIDLTCSPAALESEIITLDKKFDNTPDGQDGSAAGVVQWTLCP